MAQKDRALDLADLDLCLRDRRHCVLDVVPDLSRQIAACRSAMVPR